jgi:hypothetical protein
LFTLDLSYNNPTNEIITVDLYMFIPFTMYSDFIYIDAFPFILSQNIGVFKFKYTSQTLDINADPKTFIDLTAEVKVPVKAWTRVTIINDSSQKSILLFIDKQPIPTIISPQWFTKQIGIRFLKINHGF